MGTTGAEVGQKIDWPKILALVNLVSSMVVFVTLIGRAVGYIVTKSLKHSPKSFHRSG